MVVTPTNDDEKRVFTDIQKFGTHVVHVFEEDELPGFTYTIGLWWKLKHPEIIVIGLKSSVAHFILNEICDRIAAGEVFEQSRFYDGLLEGFECQFHSVDKTHYQEYVGWARWFYEGNNFPLLQCVYPSTKGNFPWEDGASDWFRAWQPILSGNVTISGKA